MSTYAAYDKWTDETLRDPDDDDTYRRPLFSIIHDQTDLGLKGAAHWIPGEGWTEVDSDNDPVSDWGWNSIPRDEETA